MRAPEAQAASLLSPYISHLHIYMGRSGPNIRQWPRAILPNHQYPRFSAIFFFRRRPKTPFSLALPVTPESRLKARPGKSI